MMDRIDSNASSLARSAIESALKRQAQSVESLKAKAAQVAGESASTQATPGFSDMLSEGLREVNGAVQEAENVHLGVVRGELDLHEVAAQLKQSELAFDFAMQIRNKLIDSYREVMRMSV